MSTTEHAVALKLPAFWTSQPEVWFAQAEAQFNLRKIDTDETKYYYVVAALDQSTAARLIDLISNPPDKEKYSTLKTRLTNTFGLSKRERASRLLHFRPLGDNRPSSLMDEMLALLGEHKPCLLFEQLFLERLPEDIRVQLVGENLTDLRALARRADALWDCRDAHMECNTTHRRTPAEKKQPDLCFYHRKYGEAARQCRQPCTWTPGNEKAGVIKFWGPREDGPGGALSYRYFGSPLVKMGPPSVRQYNA